MKICLVSAFPPSRRGLNEYGFHIARELQRDPLLSLTVLADELDGAVEDWIGRLRACAPLALRAIKQMVSETAQLSVPDAMRHLTPAMVSAMESEDAKEGVLAFNEHRPPRWEGR